MKKLRFWSAAAVAAAALFAPTAQAQIQVLGAGSSALWQTAAISAYQLATNVAGPGAGHYTVGGNCSSGPCAAIIDNRGSGAVPESGNLWIVWSADYSQIWAYISVDSVVGNRAFFSAPRASLGLDPALPPGQNRISSALWGDASVDSPVPAAVVGALVNNSAFTTAFTDIRPEDAKFAQDRVAGPLGYGGGVGAPIQSTFSGASAKPVDFSILGGDPFTGIPVPAFTTISVGAAPIVFIVNRSNSNGLGSANPTNANRADLSNVFSGSGCDSSTLQGQGPGGVPMTVVLREPLSGTMNTTEFTTFAPNSQENNVNPFGDNPLNQQCGSGGVRQRAIGTGEVVNTAVKNTPDSIGYAFFGYGNFAQIAGNSNYGYLTVDGVDPINAFYADGILPTCTAPCPATPGTSFPNLRNGTYDKWSILRVVTDGVGTPATQSLVSGIQANINSTVPDFVPYAPVGQDPGLQLYRSHFFQSGVQPSNGLPGDSPEAGGDVGGCVRPLSDPAPGVLGCQQ